MNDNLNVFFFFFELISIQISEEQIMCLTGRTVFRRKVVKVEIEITRKTKLATKKPALLILFLLK